MTSIRDIIDLPTPPPVPWKAGVDWEGDVGEIRTGVTQDPSDEPGDEQWDFLFKRFGLDPEKVKIVGPVRGSTWDVPGHGTFYAWKARFEQRPEHSSDIEELLDIVWTEDEYVPVATDEGWRTLQIGDTHLGKGELDGGGSELLARRWKSAVEAALKLDMFSLEGIHLAFMGDLIEGEVSQGGKNIANNDLLLSESLTLARHLVVWTIEQALEAAPRVIVSAIPGNHGETGRIQNRPLHDSHDIDIVRCAQLVFDHIPDYKDRIDWYYPSPGTGHLVYEVGDTVFASAHGHLFKAQLKGAEDWWRGMSAAGHPAGAANILMAGHYHSSLISNFQKDKWIAFSAALETKSTWINERNGVTSKPGILTYKTAAGEPFEFSVVQ